MIPSLLLVGIGWQRRVPVPLPLVLLWPLVFLATALTAGWRVLAHPGQPVLPPSLSALYQLAGLRLDLRTADGKGLLLWFI